MEEILTAISQVGFPIAISVYLLMRFEQKMDILSKNIDSLTNKIDELCQRRRGK